MLTGYVPDPATPPPPGPQFATLAPGTTESHAQNPLAPAFQYKITIDVPDAQGSGHLEVRENGVVKNAEPIRSDTIWVYIVI